MQGSLDARGHPRLALQLRGPLSSTTVQAIVDTGFTGALSIPSRWVTRLGLPQRDIRPTVLADGSYRVVRIYLIDIDWIGGVVTAEAFESASDEVLVGAGLLQGRLLTVDYGPARSVEIR